MHNRLAEDLRKREDGHKVSEILNETVENAADEIMAMTPDRAMELAGWMQERDMRWELVLAFFMARAAQGVDNDI